MELKQQLKLSQQLVITPQLQQAIKLLLLNHMELQAAIDQELQENPVLEELPNGAQETSSEELDLPSSVDTTETSLADAIGAEPTPADTARLEDQDIDWEKYLENYFASGPATGPAERIPDDELPNYEKTLANDESLVEHLMWQLRMTELTDWEMAAAVEIIGNLDEDGRLTDISILEELTRLYEVDASEIEEVLKVIQEFDPAGVATRSLQECLMVQAAARYGEDSLPYRMLKSHWDDFINRRLPPMVRALGVSKDDLIEAIKLISRLDPKPGRNFSGTRAQNMSQYITPDLYVQKTGKNWQIILNEDGLPKLRISPMYLDQLRAANGKDGAKAFIQEKLRNAQWLIKSIHQRQRTIYRVMECILELQRDFFEYGPGRLRPMVLRDVAEKLELHESTISRVTTNKYVHTPHGVYELKYFFGSGVSSGAGGEDVAAESVKQAIQKLVAAENPRKPLSDQDLVDELRKQNIQIARRTIAKYREMLRIPSSSQRKRVF